MVEEVDVITGGFNAEFGNAQSGIVNIVTREGSSEYHGHVRITTDELSPEQSYGYNSLQASFGGPIVPGRLTFFGSLEATGAEDYFPRVAGFNPAVTPGFTATRDTSILPRSAADPTPRTNPPPPPRYLVRAHSGGSTDRILPGNRGDETVFQSKLAAFLPGNVRITGTYIFSRQQQEDFTSSLTASDQFRSGAWREKSHDIIVGYDQQIFQKGDRNLSLKIRGNLHQTKSRWGVPATREAAAEMRDRLPDCGAAWRKVVHGTE